MSGLALATAFSGGALAQTGSDPADRDEGDAIIVTGTRSQGREALKSSAPVDVVDAQKLAATGYPDLGRALNFLQPAVNFARPATTATAANVRPITLRGLSPDQTLVLVNGKRRHANAILNVNNSIGRGTAAVDLDAIPASAIARIEVLRDGAAAQYGSDAIAGVVNIILKSDAQGGSISLQGGATEEGDGENGTAMLTYGLRLGDEGHLTLSALYRIEEPTNRALVDQRFGRVTYRIGDPKSEVGSLALDFAAPLGSGEIYGFGTYTHKRSNNGAGFRVPGFSPLYPWGFLPIIEPTIDDAAATLGYRIYLGDRWKADLSQTWGYNDAHFRVFDTANVSLGLASPTAFDAGTVTYQQFVTDAVLSRPLDGVLAGGNIALGGQYRHETYEIGNGEPAAYSGTGADGFAGFNPRNPTDAGRNAWAAFADLELRPVAELLLGGALRYDHYDDFGGKLTWRATGRLDLIDGFALRGTIGTGFKAPSLQQQYFSAVQGALSGATLVTVGTLPVSDPVSRALGASPLKAERSRNVTAGVVVTPTPRLSLTADFYHIRIRDRIALSEQLGGAAVTAILQAAGIANFQQARFFTNAVDTTTKGVEVSARWRGDLGPETRFDLGLGYGIFDTRLDRLRANPVLPTLPLLGLKSILLLTQGQPEDKFTAQLTLTHGPVDLQVNYAAFGKYQSLPLTQQQAFPGKSTTDAALGYTAGALRIVGGVQNLFDVRPQEIVYTAAAIASTGGSFPTGEETPIGLNGRTWYARVALRF
ncbi:TonB-dependent receptor [Novosphingobium sp. PS1R-30]|uniref:TonB-dependent receptor n=1 Tax=Novosphingobium anseongense TaxID=3133436 RepID=A0ABU8RTT2_9SPHN